MRSRLSFLLVVAFLTVHQQSRGDLIQYGAADVLNGSGVCPIDPPTGATLEGLAPNVVTCGAPELDHGFPFTPSVGEFPGTDQIFVGSVQTDAHDGYSVNSPLNGPQVFVL